MTQDLFRHLRAHTSGENNKNMKPLDARQELLVITMEECGELIQACSKALRRGELYTNSDSEQQLKQEIADVYCMIELMQDWDVLSWEEIERGVERKREKLKRWSKLIGVYSVDQTDVSEAEEIYAEDIENEVHEVEQPDPPKSDQMEMNFPSNSVTWRQALGDVPRPYGTVDENGYAKVTYDLNEQDHDYDR